MKTRKLFLFSLGIFAVLFCKEQNLCLAQGQEPIVPGQQAPPANPGQRNFGGMIPSTPQPGGMQARPRPQNAPRPQRPAPQVREIAFNDLSMSDPFIFADQETKTYYLTSSGGSMYKSKDLKIWTGPYNVIDISGLWLERAGFVAAAEIHKIGDKYYYFGTWSDHSDLIQYVPRRYNVPHNQTYILASDNIMGPYKSIAVTPGYDYEPREWDCIDGTYFEEDGHKYMVFVHEWTQLIDGTMDYIELSQDLTSTISKKPVTLFRASEAPWSLEMNTIGEATFGLKMPGWVTDGPQLFRTQTGKLGMLWSTWGAERYLQGICYSESGTIDGPWVQEPEPFLSNNSGHGMLFRTFEGKLLYIVHHSEGNGPRKPQLWNVDDSGDKLILLDRIQM